MEYHKNILGTIGNTPLVKLNKITKEVPGLVLAKIESFNPGNSIKDRMALKMIEDAESSGKLKKGGTIVEATVATTRLSLHRLQPLLPPIPQTLQIMIIIVIRKGSFLMMLMNIIPQKNSEKNRKQ